MKKNDKKECGIILGLMLIMIICIAGCKEKDEFETTPEYVLIPPVRVLS